MKKNYKRVKGDELYYCGWRNEWRPQYHERTKHKYHFNFPTYYRYVKTFNEIKQNHFAEEDGYKVRGKRKYLPTVWDDPRIGRTYWKSWKDFTKFRKQYMINL